MDSIETIGGCKIQRPVRSRTGGGQGSRTGGQEGRRTEGGRTVQDNRTGEQEETEAVGIWSSNWMLARGLNML